jgi:V/A-type H+-transporting ATPase subunit K
LRPQIPLWIILYALLITLSFIFTPLAAAEEQPAAAEAQTTLQPSIVKFLSAAIAFVAAAMGAGWAVSKAGAAGLAASAERPEIRTTAIIIAALGEAIAIYGIVIAILILGQPT